MKTFNQKFVNGAIEHMNDDHRDAMVDMLHGFHNATWVTDAEMLHFDAEKMRVKGLGENDKSEEFDIVYDEPLATAKQFRPVLIKMLQKARTQLPKK
ncbi:MAG: DUF2470 domain-containing protein [Bacteroidota bacterium]